MELARFPSRGGFSVRSILTFVLAVLTTVILWAIFSGAPAHAADASWSGAAIKYDGNQYTSAGKVQKDDGTGLPVDSTYYVYIETPQVTGTSGQTLQKAHIIYFTPGTDPPTATSANYVTYDYNPSATKKFSNPTDQKTISVDNSGANSGGTSCAIEGIGWIVCPVMNFLSGGMDVIFNLIADFMKVQPLQTGNTQGSLYAAWNIMRSIANIAFIIAFIIIIYSQLTNIQVSNYGIKKLMPRIIIAAIVINLSYIICAVAVDASNILGYALQDVFNSLRDQILATGSTDNTASLLSWQSVTGFVLSGGTAALALGVGIGSAIVATGGTATAAVFILLPALVGLLLAILVVLLILAARQALIVILVIIAPLALVAYLLPNTEKWFKKWRELLTTMLIFFPAFSVVFGGSQLAGAVIIKNATSINMVILGMIVQVAPLVITPLILRFSGSLLGNIARLVNNPNKGILDRTRKWSQDHAEMHRKRGISPMDRKGNYKPLTKANFARRSARYLDQRKRVRDDIKKTADTLSDAQYGESRLFNKYDFAARSTEADAIKEAVHKKHDEHVQGIASTRGSTLNVRTLELEDAKIAADRASAQTSSMISAYRAGIYDLGDGDPDHPPTYANYQRLADLKKSMAANVIQTAAWKQADENHKYQENRAIATEMRKKDNNYLLDIAQGHGTVDMQDVGRDRAQASAVATLTKLNADARQNTITLMETEAVEAKMSVKDYAIKNVFRKELAQKGAVTRSQLEAALEIAASDGQVTVFDDARASETIDQDIVDAVVARHVPDMKSKGGFHIQANPQLSLQRYIEAFNNGDRSKGATLDEVRSTFDIDLKKARIDTLSNTTSNNLGGMKYGAFELLSKDMVGKNLLDVIQPQADGTYSEDDMATAQKIFESLRGALEDPFTRASITDRLAYARDMEEAVRQKFFPTAEPLKLSDAERQVPGGGKRPAPVDENFPVADPNIDPTEGSPSESDTDDTERDQD